MHVEPFRMAHLHALAERPTQAHIGAFLQCGPYLQALERSDSWTAFDGDRILGCAGLLPIWPGLSHCWALLADDIGAGMIGVTRCAHRMLRMHTGRIEAYVEAEFEAGHRWARILGFERDTPGVLRKWFPDGSGAVLYSRVN